MATQSENDAGFFTLAHEVLEAAERRISARKPYNGYRLVAPYDGKMPTADQFRQVRCHDLSGTGISYFDDESPTHSQIVLLSPEKPNELLIAEIVHRTRVPNLEYLIGCRFIG